MASFSWANTVRSKWAVVNTNRTTFGAMRMNTNASGAELSHTV
jgi:hypothetical protein